MNKAAPIFEAGCCIIWHSPTVGVRHGRIFAAFKSRSSGLWLYRLYALPRPGLRRSEEMMLDEPWLLEHGAQQGTPAQTAECEAWLLVEAL
jgi:hypothetical protein